MKHYIGVDVGKYKLDVDWLGNTKAIDNDATSIKPLVEQLKEGGRIIIPVGGQWYQELVLGVKKKGRLEKSMHGGCVFVPLRY